MNEETRLILYSLKWVIERDTFNEELRKEMDKDICNKIVDLVNPIKEESIREKTEDAFSESKVPTHKEFQKAIDKSELRGYKFANQKQDEVKKDEWIQ